MSDNKMKVVITPEALANMEKSMTAAEIEQLLSDFQAAVESGDIFEQSEPVDLEAMKIEDPEMYAELVNAMHAQGFDSLEDWAENASIPPTLN